MVVLKTENRESAERPKQHMREGYNKSMQRWREALGLRLIKGQWPGEGDLGYFNEQHRAVPGQYGNPVRQLLKVVMGQIQYLHTDKGKVLNGIKSG